MAAGLAGRSAQVAYWMRQRRSLIAALFAFAIMALFFAFLYVQTVTGEFNAQFIVGLLPEFLFGLQLTLILTVVSFLVGILLGFSTAAARISRSRVLRGVAKGYVDVFRGTPILIQILLWFTVILAVMPTYTFRLFVAGFLALTINTGAYQAEIFRGGMKAIPEGQLEAGRALGFGSWQLMRHIRLPQTLRLIIPPMTNEFILLLKSSALLSIIGITELAFIAQQCTREFFLPFECWTTATLLYLAMTVPLAKLVQYTETRFRIPGLGVPVARGGLAPMAPPAATEGVDTARPVRGRRVNGLYRFLEKRMRAAQG
jgi:polar amino acid transport system permease protein